MAASGGAMATLRIGQRFVVNLILEKRLAAHTKLQVVLYA